MSTLTIGASIMRDIDIIRKIQTWDNMRPQFKALAYAYPSSDMASDLGFKATGCHYVLVQFDNCKTKMKGFDDKATAIDFLDAIDVPKHRYCMTNFNKEGS